MKWKKLLKTTSAVLGTAFVAASVIAKVKKGDSIYDADADFSIDLNAACIAKIKSYNDEQEKIDLGFGDYTLGSISKESREYKSKFLQDLRENPGTCVIKEKTTN